MTLEGGHPALDFVNTTHGARDQPPEASDELLRSYDDLLVWGVRVGLLEERDAARLRRMADEDDAGARAAHRDALALRDLIYSVLRPLAEGGEPPAEALERLREREREALGHATLAPAEAAMSWTWPAPAELAAPLRPLVHAALELLTQGPLDRVSLCANCRWLFLDRSKNRSRRWCSMKECGGQIKRRKFVDERRRRRSEAS